MTDQINITAALLDGTDVSFTAFGKTITFTDYRNEAPVEETPISAIAFDAKTTAISEDLVSVSHGHISPRAGGGTYINLTELPPGNTITQITGETAEGQAVTIPVSPRRMLKGFSDGRHWMLRVDKPTGRIRFRVGRNGRKYYITKRPRNDPGGKGGYTAVDIANADGVSLSSVTSTYIKNSPKWGRSEDFPLEMNLGFAVWGSVTSLASTASALFAGNQMLLECGYDYNDGVWASSRSFISRQTSGESPMHPVVVSSYGTGAKPKIQPKESALDHQIISHMTWIAFDNVEMGFLLCNGSCDMMLSNTRITHRGFVAPEAGHITLHRNEIYDAHLPQPDREYWGKNNSQTGYPSHTYGAYASEVASFLSLEDYFDHNGWVDGYNPDSNLTIYPYYPFSLSHNIYLTFNFVNTTIRRQINARAASQGIQCRGGGTFEDVLIIDANLMFNNLGIAKSLTGASQTVDAGNFPTVRRSVGTSAGHKRAFTSQGAISRGIDVSGYDGFLELIIMHRANPADPAEIAEKTTNSHAWKPDEMSARGFKDRMRVYNWNDYGDAGRGPADLGVSATTLNQTTIQNFAETRMDLTGVAEGDKLAAYASWLRTRTPAQREVERKAALAYFYGAWGVTIPNRTTAANCTFVPNTEEGSGILWADYANWSTQTTAGSVDGDSADLRGCKVVFGEMTVDMATVDGSGGILDMSSGHMTVDNLTDLREVIGSFCAELVIGAASNIGAYTWKGGTLVFEGAASGHSLTVDGQYPEVLLGPDHTIAAGEVLDVRCGAQGAVGWDGTGTATLTIASGGTLRLRNFAATYGARMSRLERFRSGMFGDEIEPTVTPTLVLASGSIVEVDKTGLAAGTHDLTGPGVTVTNNGATLPAGVTLTGGKLTLVIS